MKKHNSQECAYLGYKLSCIDTGVEVKDGYLNIGCDDDDTFYKRGGKPENTGRVTVSVNTMQNRPMNDLCEVYESSVQFDLEDLLVFAKKYCTGIYERVNKEVRSEKVD